MPIGLPTRSADLLDLTALGFNEIDGLRNLQAEVKKFIDTRHLFPFLVFLTSQQWLGIVKTFNYFSEVPRIDTDVLDKGYQQVGWFLQTPVVIREPVCERTS